MKENDQHTHAHSDPRLKHRHKSHGHRGKRVILVMSLLVLSHLGIIFFLSATGHPHALTEEWGYTTRMISHGLFTAVVLLCLILLYRGSISVKHLVGFSGLIIAFVTATMIVWNVLTEPLTYWTAIDSLGALAAGVAAWACIFSRRVTAFLHYQDDHH